MNPASVEEAVLHTLLYADIFDYPLTPAEIYHYLLEYSTTPEQVQTTLENSVWLAERVTRVNGYFTLKDRARLSEVRLEREQRSASLWRYARRWAYLTGCLPFVRMVGITGALAVSNSPPNDDIDFLIVTTSGRVWLTRAFSVALVYLARALHGVVLCPNYVLAETALTQERRNLFVAHDLAQMVPLVGHDMYDAFRAANRWSARYLPHAQRPLKPHSDLAPHGLALRLKRLGERLLSGALGDWLENWERQRKLRKFAPAALRPDSAAQLDADHVKGHFNDYTRPILQKYEERLVRYLGIHWEASLYERSPLE